MVIDGRRPAPETHSQPGRLKTRGSREAELARAATRRRVNEAALAAAVRELRTRRRPGMRAR